MKKGRTNLTLNIDAEVKEEAERVLSELGVRTSDAVEMFLRQVIMQGGLPFKVKLPRVRKRHMPAFNYIPDAAEDRYIEPAETGDIRNTEAAKSAEAADMEIVKPDEGTDAEVKKPAETEKAKLKGKKITSKATLVIKEPKKPRAEAEDEEGGMAPAGGPEPDVSADMKEGAVSQEAGSASEAPASNEDPSGAAAPVQPAPLEADKVMQPASVEAYQAGESAYSATAPYGEAPQAEAAAYGQGAEPVPSAAETAPQAEEIKATVQEKPKKPSIIELRRDVETGLYKISVFLPDNEEEDGKAWIGDLMIGDEHQNVGKLSQITREDGTLDPDEFRFSKDVSYVEHSFARKYMYTDSAPMTVREMVDAACDFLHEKGVEAISYFSASNSDRSKMEEIGFSYMGKSQSGLLPVNQYVR